MKILLVEDEESIRYLISINLKMIGYEVLEAEDGELAKEIIENEKIDLILLDVMIPKIDGFTLANLIKDKRIPLIFLTAKTSTDDKVRGLRLGGDDYITKPFETIELIARIEAVLRRYGTNDKILKIKNIEIFTDEHIVKKDNSIIDLTSKEYDLLMMFISNKNIALSRNLILQKVWNYDYLGGTRTVDIHVGRLREKLDLEDCIKTVFKIGYRLEL